jgi:hypothetical protein
MKLLNIKCTCECRAGNNNKRLENELSVENWFTDGQDGPNLPHPLEQLVPSSRLLLQCMCL